MMIFLAMPEGLTDEEKAALAQRMAARIEESMRPVFEGMDPLDTGITRALITRACSDECPSYDQRLSMVTQAFEELLGVLITVRPEGKELWGKKAAEYRAAFEKVRAEIHGEQAAKHN